MKTLLQLGGVLHFLILGASALTPRVLDWRENLAPLPPLLRQLFWVYGSFIVLVIVGFGAISVAHAEVLASGGALARSICAFVAVFWAARLAVQFFVFDAAPFLTSALLKLGYHALTAAFILLVAIYSCGVFL
jgi:hypothetical protein